jgi:linoleoyl-CoA desaturase
MMGVASNTHTSSHYATSNRRWINEALTFFGCSFILGLSATYWWHKHGRHHSCPNVHGEDEDASFWPWFALTDVEVQAAKKNVRTYYVHFQRFVFPLAIALNAPNMQKNGIAFLYEEMRRLRGREVRLWIDAAGLAAHMLVSIVLPSILWGGTWAVALYWARVTAFGYAMFLFFGPAHLPAEAAVLETVPKRRRLLFVLAATVNFRAGTIGRWLGSGLDHQIEHHLFPNVSHVHYSAISPLVESFCRTNGLPYRQIGWAQGLRSALRAMRIPKIVLRSSDIRMLEG